DTGRQGKGQRLQVNQKSHHYCLPHRRKAKSCCYPHTIAKSRKDLYRFRHGQGFFFTSHGPATREIDVEALHKVVEEIRRISL
ncbi:MAG: hypothetical protein WBG50_15490, partial [Desulfomonilaceae bacterium]